MESLETDQNHWRFTQIDVSVIYNLKKLHINIIIGNYKNDHLI